MVKITSESIIGRITHFFHGLFRCINETITSKKQYMKKQMIILAGLSMGLIACQKTTATEPVASNDCTAVTYAGTIKPLFDSRCITCHGATSGDGPITNYAQTKALVDNGKLKLTVLTTRSMPQGSTLTAGQLGQVQCWLDAGAPNN